MTPADGASGAAEFEAGRPRLLGLAYRMLGEMHEAEDVVQDAYLRWRATDREAVREPLAWLVKVVTNLCLSRLTAARARREAYPGTWLPEPVPDAAGVLGPLDTAALRDSVSLALLALLERLTPAERAVFVLHEAFSYPHREIAEILGLTDAASRQLHHRARRRIETAERRFAPDPRAWRRLVEGFLAAAARGDVAALERILAEEVTAYTDGGGKVSAARNAITGRDRVLRYFVGLARHAGGVAFAVEEVNGALALVARDLGEPVMVMVPEIDGDRVVAVRTVVNPDKLRFIARTPPGPGEPAGP